jgi:hypothetical protein
MDGWGFAFPDELQPAANMTTAMTAIIRLMSSPHGATEMTEPYEQEATLAFRVSDVMVTLAIVAGFGYTAAGHHVSLVGMAKGRSAGAAPKYLDLEKRQTVWD